MSDSTEREKKKNNFVLVGFFSVTKSFPWFNFNTTIDTHTPLGHNDVRDANEV